MQFCPFFILQLTVFRHLGDVDSRRVSAEDQALLMAAIGEEDRTEEGKRAAANEANLTTRVIERDLDQCMM